MTALNETTLTRVLEALKEQNWTLTPSPSGDRWRAEPPDPKRKAVKFVSRPSALTPILRELREQGFRWPPGEQKDTSPPPVVRSVPFPPKPHPDVTTIALGTVEPDAPAAARVPLALVKAPNPSRTADEAFEKLKETRDYAELAGAELRDAQVIFDLAEASLAGAKATYDDALRQMAEAKRDFDDLFNRPGQR